MRVPVKKLNVFIVKKILAFTKVNGVMKKHAEKMTLQKKLLTRLKK